MLNRFLLSWYNTVIYSPSYIIWWISQGIGEPPLLLAVTVHKAIRSAILAARKDMGLTDFIQLDCPVTPTKVLEACHKKVPIWHNQPVSIWRKHIGAKWCTLDTEKKNYKHTFMYNQFITKIMRWNMIGIGDNVNIWNINKMQIFSSAIFVIQSPHPANDITYIQQKFVLLMEFKTNSLRCVVCWNILIRWNVIKINTIFIFFFFFFV